MFSYLNITLLFVKKHALLGIRLKIHDGTIQLGELMEFRP